MNALALGWFIELDLLKFFTNPVGLLSFSNVHELHSDFTAVSLAVGVNELT